MGTPAEAPATAATEPAAPDAARDAELLDGGALSGLLGDHLRGIWGRPAVLDVVMLAIGLPLAWLFRFSQDDAYISFRYARNLAEGHGLVFNVGDRVEGYTNFLWTWLMSVPFRLDMDPLAFAHLVGLVCFAATLLALRRLAALAFGPGPLPAVAAAVFLTSHTVLIYGTGSGLETQLQVALITWALVVTLRLRRACSQGSPGRVVALCVALSALAGLALLTRLDSAVVLVVLAVIAVAALVRRPEGSTRSMVGPLLALAVPVAVLVVPWLVWKSGFYGSVLPNTLTAKSTPLHLAVLRSLLFLAVYLLVTAQVLLVPVIWRHRRALVATPELRVLRLVVGVWLAYLAVVGADFMEFRFLVVALPAVAVLMAAVLASLQRVAVLVFCVAVLVVGSGIKWKLMPSVLAGIESATGLDQHGVGDTSWRAVGEVLADAFPGGPDAGVSIAVTPAGFIPFYSELPTVDMLGLNDTEVLEDPCELTWIKAGHEQVATPAHLADRGVDLVLGASLPREADATRSEWTMDDVRDIFLLCPLERDDLPAEATMVEIPLTSEWVVPAILFDPASPAAEVAAERGWRVLPIG